MEAQLLDHQPRHDLCLARLLKRRLHGMQFLLPDEEREQPDVDPVKVVVHVAQPLVLVLAVALRLVEEYRHDAAAIASAGILDPVDKLEPLGRIAPLVRFGAADGLQQAGEERPLCMLGLVLGLHVIDRDLGKVLRHRQARVLDGARLADPRGPVDQRAGDHVVHAALDEIVKGLDGRRADAVVAHLQRMEVAGNKALVAAVAMDGPGHREAPFRAGCRRSPREWTAGVASRVRSLTVESRHRIGRCRGRCRR